MCEGITKSESYDSCCGTALIYIELKKARAKPDSLSYRSRNTSCWSAGGASRLPVAQKSHGCESDSSTERLQQ